MSVAWTTRVLTPLSARHRYCPPSSDLTPLITRLLLARTLKCSSWSTGCPSFTQNNTGVGFPVAVQFHTKVAPSSIMVSWGVSTNSAEISKSIINKHSQIYIFGQPHSLWETFGDAVKTEHVTKFFFPSFFITVSLERLFMTIMRQVFDKILELIITKASGSE